MKIGGEDGSEALQRNHASLLAAWRELHLLLHNPKAKPALRVELALHVMDRLELGPFRPAGVIPPAPGSHPPAQ